MANIKISILLVLSFTITNLSAQIEDEIMSFKDTTVEIVENGRKMIMQKIISSDLKKSQDVYNYLRKISKENSSAAFTYNEDLLISIILVDWDRWFELAGDYKFESIRVVYPSYVNMLSRMQDVMPRDSSVINNKITKAKFEKENKDALEIYWHYLKNGSHNIKYKNKLKLFNENYPLSKYKIFFDTYLPQAPVKSSFGFSLGILQSVPDNLLANSFSPTLGFYFSLDVNVQRVFSSLYMQGSSPKLQTQFSAISGIDTLNFSVNESFNHLSGGVLLGYFVLRNKRFHIAPYFSLAGVYIRSKRFDPKDSDKEISPVSSFVYGPGLHLEAKIFQFKSKPRYNNYIYYQSPVNNNHLSFKTEFGYDINTKANFSAFKGNLGYLRAGHVWAFGAF